MSLCSHLKEKYSQTIQTITDLSKNDDGKPLVKHKSMYYCFDDIAISIFGKDETPCSADAIFFDNKTTTLYFIEFKTGLKRKITKENFDDSKATCEFCEGVFCKHFKDLQITNGNLQVDILKDSIKLKLLESYSCLEKILLQETKMQRKDIKVNFICVTDLPHDDTGNLEKSLNRFKDKVDKQGNKYLFDDISVLTAKTFESLVGKEIPSLSISS